jgi:hypothetical protein
MHALKHATSTRFVRALHTRALHHEACVVVVARAHIHALCTRGDMAATRASTVHHTQQARPKNAKPGWPTCGPGVAGGADGAVDTGRTYQASVTAKPPEQWPRRPGP